MIVQVLVFEEADANDMHRTGVMLVHYWREHEARTPDTIFDVRDPWGKGRDIPWPGSRW